ncbi:MAG: APC family permease [Candidatus Methanomethylophilaceae archaeon]|nr:APC family permease [Candidatus Methanomethylophilaceae archaeon]
MVNHGVRILAEGNSHALGGFSSETGLVKSIDWKQGMIIAMGVPILILPGIYDIAGTAWGLSIFIWTISVLQGFAQNLAIGEMAAALETPGIGGCAQKVFTKPNGGRYGFGKFIVAFTAWAYWFTWTPVIPIFTCTSVDYISKYLEYGLGMEALSTDMTLVLQLLFGIIVFSAIVYVGSKGLSGGAKLGLILALVAILPLLVVIMMPLIGLTAGGGELTGFSIDRIVDNLTPPEWGWSAGDFMMVFGMFAYAQWCACAWESAATYGAEYKTPGKDVPKALISAGIVCLAMYFIVPFVVYGMMTPDQIDSWGVSTLYPIAQFDFGDIGLIIALILLVAGMIMLIQTAFLGSSRTLYFMGHEGNMPKMFTYTNKNGAPLVSMFFQFAMGIIFIIIIHFGSVGMILAASSFGFSFALGMGMLAYIVAKKNPRFKDLPRPYKAPRGWYYVACFLMIYQFFILIPCLAYWCINGGIENGTFSVIIGAVILLLYVPAWFILQYRSGKEEESCFVCKRTVEDYNMYVTKQKNLDFAEKEDIMGEMDSLPVILVGNTYISLCPICYELTFGFSTDPDEKLSGIKKYMGEMKYPFNRKFDEGDTQS